MSAGFAPISLGTQTGGSLIYPARKAGLYAMLPTLTTVSTEGAFRISRSFDGIGGIAKTSADLATLTEAILLPETRKSLLKGGYSSVMSGSWLGLKVGVVESTWGGANPEKWASELVVSISVIMSKRKSFINSWAFRKPNTRVLWKQCAVVALTYYTPLPLQIQIL